MGKFKLGARVRDAEGDIGEIVSKRKGERLVRYEDTDYGELWNTKDRLTVVDEPGESGEVVPAAVEWAPAVGDRVRLVKDNCGNSNWGRCGEEGTVKRVDARDTEAVVVFDESGEWFTQFHSIVPVPAPTFRKGDRALSANGDCVTIESDVDSADHVWVSHGTTKWRTPVSWLTKWEPKVGDTVRVVDGDGGGRVGDICTVIEVKDLEDGGSAYVRLSGLTGGAEGLYVYRLEPLPVARQPAVEPASDLWRPAVGKFGKTRDGRKVVIRRDLGDYLAGDIEGGPTGKTWSPDGSHGGPYVKRIADHDLVSEWVEPIPEPKFKVGDLVRCVKDYRGTVTSGKIYTIAYFNADEPRIGVTEADHGGADGLPAHYFEPYTPQPYTIGTRVTLNAPASITAIHDGKASLKLATGGSYTLPLAALTPTN